MKKREGESEKAWFRSNRFYNLNGQWFFTTREGVDYGPFETKEEALEELTTYLNVATVNCA